MAQATGIDGASAEARHRFRYLGQISRDTSSPFAEEEAADGLQPILPEALRVCRAWLDGMPVDDFNRQSVLHLEALTENLIRNGKPPTKAMLRVQSYALRQLPQSSCR